MAAAMCARSAGSISERACQLRVGGVDTPISYRHRPIRRASARHGRSRLTRHGRRMAPVVISYLGSCVLAAPGRGWYIERMSAAKFVVEIEREDDGRWIAEVVALSGVMAYGSSREDALARVEVLALRVLADRLEHGEAIPQVADLFHAA